MKSLSMPRCYVTEPANFELVAEQQCFGDVQSYPDFDNVSELTVDVAGDVVSKEVLFAFICLRVIWKKKFELIPVMSKS